MDLERDRENMEIGNMTPRRTPRSVVMRSSISYSPAQKGSNRFEEQMTRGTRKGNAAEVGEGGNEGKKEKRKGETLTERCVVSICQSRGILCWVLTEFRHADLLTLIAQKERRVNELRQGRCCTVSRISRSHVIGTSLDKLELGNKSRKPVPADLNPQSSRSSP